MHLQKNNYGLVCLALCFVVLSTLSCGPISSLTSPKPANTSTSTTEPTATSTLTSSENTLTDNADLSKPEKVVLEAFNAYRELDEQSLNALLTEEVSTYCVNWFGSLLACFHYPYEEDGLSDLQHMRTELVREEDTRALVHLHSSWLEKGEQDWYQKYLLIKTGNTWLISDFSAVSRYFPPTPTPAAPQNASIGRVTSLWDGSFTVIGWERGTESCFGYELNEDYKMIWVDAVLIYPTTGHGPLRQEFFEMTLKDSTAQIYTEPCRRDNRARNESKTYRNEFGFEVPIDAEDFEIVVDTPAKKVFVPLGDVPTSVAMPQELILKPEMVFKVGEDDEDFPVTILLNEARTATEEESPYVPPDGYKHFIVDLTVKNQGETEFEVSSKAQMWIQDFIGQRYQPAYWSNFPDISLVPGEEVRGQIAFEIPVADYSFWFMYDTTDPGGEKVIFSVQ